MSVYSRRHDISICGHLYKKKFRNYKFCVYCGDPATEWDHVFPVSVAANVDWMSNRTLYEYRRGLVMVPSCGECNNVACDGIYKSVVEKRNAIHIVLRRRYRKILSVPLWSDDELSELGHSMRTSVLASQAALLRLLRRITWPRSF